MNVRFGLAALALAGVLGFAGATHAEEKYSVDPVHSTVIFKITHFNMAPFYGRFNEPTGNFVLDEDPAKTSFNFEIQADKVDTANEKRNAHLKGPDFFNAKQFPTITYKSNKVTKAPNGAYEVEGDLTLHGVTKPVKVTIEKTGQGKDPMGKERAGLAATFTIRRADFGISFMPGALGDDVTLMTGIEGLKQ